MEQQKKKRPGRPENLKYIRTTERARELGRLGGIKSHQNKKKRLLLSEAYAKYLTENHLVKIGRTEKNLTPEEIIFRSVTKTLLTGTNATVGMLKEIADRTEGLAGAGSDSTRKDADLLGALLGTPRTTPDEEIDIKDNEE